MYVDVYKCLEVWKDSYVITVLTLGQQKQETTTGVLFPLMFYVLTEEKALIYYLCH